MYHSNSEGQAVLGLPAEGRAGVESLCDQSSYQGRLGCLVSNTLYRRTESSAALYSEKFRILFVIDIRTSCFIWITFKLGLRFL